MLNFVTHILQVSCQKLFSKFGRAAIKMQAARMCGGSNPEGSTECRFDRLLLPTQCQFHYHSATETGTFGMSWRGLSRAQIAEQKASFESEGPSFVYEEIQRRKSKPIDPQLFVIPSGVSEQTWVYENLRSLVCDLNFLIASLDGVCDITSCPLMTATPEWEYK